MIQNYTGQSKSASQRQITRESLIKRIPSVYSPDRQRLYSGLDKVNLQNWLIKDFIYEGKFGHAFALIDCPSAALYALETLQKYEPMLTRKHKYNGFSYFWRKVSALGLTYNKATKTFEYVSEK